MVNDQGKVVVERDGAGGFWAMMPDGGVQHAATERDAERVARSWLKRHADSDAVNVGRIEWRDGIVPPGGQS